jgi:hypothetical protein
LHPFAIGDVDERGVHFTRYLRTKTWSWDSIGKINWDGARLTVMLKQEGYFNGLLLFWLAPSYAMRGYQAQRNGETPTPPPILNRIAYAAEQSAAD